MKERKREGGKEGEREGRREGRELYSYLRNSNTYS